MKEFLTIKQCKDKGLEYIKYSPNVYKYNTTTSYWGSPRWTLIIDNKKIVDKAEIIHWYEPGVYEYEKKGKWVNIDNEI